MQQNAPLAFSSRSDEGSRPVPAKPPRLRSACTSCRQAKLRCSGEKTGCFRCTKLGLKCEYAISMVGRASKKKHSLARKGQLQSIATEIQHGAPNINSPGSAIVGDVDLVNCFSGGLALDAFLNLQMQTPTASLEVDESIGGVFTTLCDAEILPTPPQGLETATSQPTTSISSLSIMDGCLTQSLSPPWLPQPANCHSLSANPDLCHRSILSPVSHDPHRAHMATLGKCIATLDSHLAESNCITIDRVLSISRNCTDEIAVLMGLDNYQACRSCRTLVANIVDLLLELYEKASTPASDPSGGLSTKPKLSLGAYTIDTTEYSALYKQIISSELRRLNPIIESLKSGCSAVAGSCKRARHQGLFSEMEWRLYKLISSESASSPLDTTN
ncbi:fungal zn(2)-Cys(6) binuclear cluster domain-containing protein [Fusarium austroafricanum]|uniref:Fungal zn(2)-Cys(6) binuclear cluster domain-containing protein n=1 Tax=Fusarium austroafricanum TaxID=2364996 RepID=A0A8H4KTA2_9HYPO|nr:fungal zn(2)-Cys(6) binuclear cluster domain-containing protein [Fusarium austroafricanum]